MEKISFSHGGPEYDAKYPDGIPTAIDITLKSGKVGGGASYAMPLSAWAMAQVMYPSGHARNTSADLKKILQHKNRMLGDIVFPERSTVDNFVSRALADECKNHGR
ncbi:prpD1 [Symbiodinium necroappetens]|uniref:PrpD1 protein n=1 Tax=Symbiodinium necroappetens TaxID=1628268 RepID=A0A812NVY8_9DINO|nr:prpD1 [Symbiodinium necroappetens]